MGRALPRLLCSDSNILPLKMNHAGTHDFLLVTLSLLVAVASSFTALDLFSRTRSSSGTPRYLWLLASAVAMGGGIWAMHFIGMLALKLPGVDLSYDLVLTLLSLVVPVVVTAGAFLLVRPEESWGLLASSGALMGSGIVAMHYTGMAAVRVAGRLHYNAFWVGVSVAIAIGAATTALWIATRNPRLKQRMGAAVVMGLAVAGMHYAAMQGLTFRPDPSMAPASAGSLESTVVGAWVAGTTFIVLLLAIAAATFDRHFAHLSDQEAAKLRASEERYRMLLRSITDYAIFMLDRQGKVTNWNSGAERIKGYQASEIVGSHFSRFYTREDLEAALPERALRTALETGRFENEGWRLRKDGSRFWANVVIEPVRDDSGDHVGFVKITRDVSDRQQAQKALEMAREALFQAQKMEAVGQLTGGVAHDFNNLLMVILGNLELLRKRLPPDERLRRFVDNSLLAADRGRALTQRMLAFARKQELKLTATDLPKLVESMSDLFERTIGPNVTIERRVPDCLPTVLADAHQLELALLNLVVNARDAMPDGGRISIAADVAKPASTLALPESMYMRLQVTDTRHRHGFGDTCESPGAILHDQRHRQRNGARPFHGARRRRTIGRRISSRERNRAAARPRKSGCRWRARATLGPSCARTPSPVSG